MLIYWSCFENTPYLIRKLFHINIYYNKLEGSNLHLKISKIIICNNLLKRKIANFLPIETSLINSLQISPFIQLKRRFKSKLDYFQRARKSFTKDELQLYNAIVAFHPEKSFSDFLRIQRQMETCLSSSWGLFWIRSTLRIVSRLIFLIETPLHREERFQKRNFKMSSKKRKYTEKEAKSHLHQISLGLLSWVLLIGTAAMQDDGKCFHLENYT